MGVLLPLFLVVFVFAVLASAHPRPALIESLQADKIVYDLHAGASITLSCSASSFQGGDFVTLTWAGVPSPSLNDWVSCYAFISYGITEKLLNMLPYHRLNS